MFCSLRNQGSAFSSPACLNLMFIFGASSLAAAVKTLPGGTFQRRRHLTALPELHLIQSSAKFRHKTLQHQLRLAVRFQYRTTTQPCRPKIIIWHDVINNSLTPHSSNFNNPLSPTALIQELRALPCDIAAIIIANERVLLTSFSCCDSRFSSLARSAICCLIENNTILILSANTESYIFPST